MSDSASPSEASEPELTPEPVDELQFLRAEPATQSPAAKVAGRSCVLCRQPIVSTYYALRDKVLCPVCSVRVTAPPAGSNVARVVKAALMGLGAGLVGALIWCVVRRATGYEIGLIAILVGYMVGTAVRKGSGGRGGLGYQILAVVLTYFCVAANYMPDIIEAFVKVINKQPGVVMTAGMFIRIAFAVVRLSLETPFLPGAENIIGLLIIGFALWEAWKFNMHRPLPITGPYQMSAGTSQAAAARLAAANGSNGG